jgi:transcriptional regulator with XRE-family HTH domain
VTLGERLLSWRLAAGLTQEEVAARGGVAVATVKGYERGRHRPGERVLRQLVEVLGPGVSS